MPPRNLPGAEGAGYELDESLVALHGADAPGDAVATFEGGTIAVVPAQGAARDAPATGPVYRSGGAGGPIAVPTGRVFVRFGAGTRAADRAGDLEAAGFDVEAVPGYAPQAAWVRPRSGRVEDALERLDAVREVAGVELVEPQLVAQGASRGDP